MGGKKNWMKVGEIKNEKEYEAVMKRIDEIWDTVPDGPEGTGSPEALELDKLCELADSYEEEHEVAKK